MWVTGILITEWQAVQTLLAFHDLNTMGHVLMIPIWIEGAMIKPLISKQVQYNNVINIQMATDQRRGSWMRGGRTRGAKTNK